MHVVNGIRQYFVKGSQRHEFCLKNTLAFCQLRFYECLKHWRLVVQITDYAFVIAMGSELNLKVLAEGLFFTPKGQDLNLLSKVAIEWTIPDLFLFLF